MSANTLKPNTLRHFTQYCENKYNGLETKPSPLRLRMIRADLCMLGVCSLHPEVGISVPNLDEAHVKRAIIAGSAEVVGLVTAEKLDTAAPYLVESIRALTYLVTAPTVSNNMLSAYKALGLTIIRDEYA